MLKKPKKKFEITKVQNTGCRLYLVNDFFIAGEITLFGNVLSDSTSVKEFLKKITVFISDSVYKGYSQGKSTVK